MDQEQLKTINEWVEYNYQRILQFQTMSAEDFLKEKERIIKDYHLNAAKINALKEIYINEYECVEKLKDRLQSQNANGNKCR